LSWKIVQFKAQTARNSQAIAKVCNTEMDNFTPQDAVSRFNQSFPSSRGFHSGLTAGYPCQAALESAFGRLPGPLLGVVVPSCGASG